MAEFLAHLRDPVLFAIPVFLLFVTIEIVALHVLGHDDNVVGYSVADTRTSMLMGTVAVAFAFGAALLIPGRVAPEAALAAATRAGEPGAT